MPSTNNTTAANNKKAVQKVAALRQRVLQAIEESEQKEKLETSKEGKEQEEKTVKTKSNQSKSFWEPAIKTLIKIKLSVLARILIIFIFIILSLLSLIFYLPKTNNYFSRKIGRLIPLPAIIINGELISYDQYWNEVDAVNKFLTKQKERGVIRQIPSERQIKEKIKEYLINQKVIKKLAWENTINVSQQEIKNEIDKIQQQTRSGDNLEKVLNDVYDWTQRDFENKVLQPHLTSLKLAKKLFPDLTEENDLKQTLDKKIAEERKKMKIYVLVR